MLSLWFERWAHIYSSSLLLSLFAFRRLYIIPVLNRDRGRSNLAEEYSLNTLKWICWLVMLLSGIAWLLAIVASITDSGIQLATVGEVLGLTQFGHLWLFRLLLGLVIAGGLLHDSLTKRSCAHLSLLCIGLAAVNLGSLAWAGHAGAGTGSFANVHLLTDLVHLLVSAVWPGGLLPLIIWFFVNPRRPENEPEAIVRRFSAISLGAVVILAVSGLLNTLFMIRRFADFYTTSYGQILTGKIILFLIMIGLGMQNRRLLKIQRSSESRIMDRSATGRLFRNLCVESAVAFVVFGLVGALGAIEPPN
jgi:putative copper resistance protein D